MQEGIEKSPNLPFGWNAWGGHKVLSGTYSEENVPEIGHKNPLRYRGYYYDTETGLYYLQTRYYDPETGRFINADDILIAASAQSRQINGLNLYAYCVNNPVTNVDPSGCSVFLTMLIIAIIAGAAIGGTMNGISAYKDGQRGLGLFGAVAGGAVMGGAMGAILVLGGAAGLSATIAPLGLTVAGFGLSVGAAFGLSVGIGVGAGLVSYSLENGLRSDKRMDMGWFCKSGTIGWSQRNGNIRDRLCGRQNGCF